MTTMPRYAALLPIHSTDANNNASSASDAATLIQRFYRKCVSRTQELENSASILLQQAKRYIPHLEKIADVCSLSHVAVALKVAVLNLWIERLRHFQNGVMWTQVVKASNNVYGIRKHMRLLAAVCGAPSLQMLVMEIMFNEAPLCFLTQRMLIDYDGVLTPLGFIKVDNKTEGRRTPRKWTNGRSMQVELSGIVIDIQLGSVVYEVYGVLPPDPNMVYMSYMWRPYYVSMLVAKDCGGVGSIGPKFAYRYFDEMLLQDMLCMKEPALTEHLKSRALLRDAMRTMPMLTLTINFVSGSIREKRDMLVILMIGDKSDQAKAVTLFTKLVKSGDSVVPTLRRYMSTRIRRSIMGKNSPAAPKKPPALSLMDQIQRLDLPDEIRRKVLDKAALAEGSAPDGKAKQYVEGILRIPFGKFKCEDIFTLKSANMTERRFDELVTLATDKGASAKDARTQRSTFLLRMRSVLDNAVHGQISMKRQLERLMGRWITGDMSGAVIGLKGPPGVGKTTIIKKGLAKCWVDGSGETRPFHFVPLGGISSGSTLVGHNYTYVGATWGRIADIVMISGCLNPIIFFDELDKVSSSPRGEEIIGVLTHLTDESQNSTFYDKYFDGVPIDLSKAVLVFSFNDERKIDPILLDRMTIIEALPLYHQEKVCIIDKYALPQLLKKTGYGPGDIVLGPGVSSMLVRTYTQEAGVRKLKQLLVEIVDEINLRRLLCGERQASWPIEVDMTLVRDILGARHKAILPPHVGTTRRPGIIHGMYATSMGVGGVLMIEVYPITGKVDVVTGTIGDVMKESITCAKSIAKSILMEGHDTADKNMAFHVHVPDASSPKDGPSAGVALSIAIWSCWTQQSLNHKIAVTGEVDLSGNVRPVGGLRAKLIGAVRAGMTKILVPGRNAPEIDNLFKEKEFRDCVPRNIVVSIDTVLEAREHFLNKN